MEEIMKSGVQYVYMYWIDGIPRYVGNGKGKRVLVHLKKKTNEKLWEFISDAIVIQKKIIATGTQEEMDSLERELIQKYGRLVDGTGNLCNLLSGGKKGCKYDEQTKKKISESHIGEKHPLFNKFALSHPSTKQKYQQLHLITGEVIAEFIGNQELNEAGFIRCHCKSVSDGKLKQHKGYNWRIILL